LLQFFIALIFIDGPLEPYRTEWRIYYYNFTGIIEMVTHNPQNDTYEIYDWKRSAGIKESAFEYDQETKKHSAKKGFWILSKII